MDETVAVDAILIGLVGGCVILCVLMTSLLARTRIPPLVGFIAIGFALRLIDTQIPFLSEPILHALRFMADLGIVALLFAIGLESHPSALAARLPKAVAIWFGEFVIAAVVGFAGAYWLLDVGLMAALVVAAALSATSVGVAVAAWKSEGSLDSSNGDLLVDVAELDDVSAIALMAVLFAVGPLLIGGDGGDLTLRTAQTLAAFALKLGIFLAICFLFAQYGERHVTAFGNGLRERPQRMLIVAGVGFLIAALAGMIGFSLAIGALAAGLVFSRDPEAVKTETSFNDISSFVTPFFFIGLGLQIDPGSLEHAWLPGLLLTGVAIAGKLIGTYAPARILLGASGATLLAVSMVPRAEITMVIMDQGRSLIGGADWLYSAMVMVTAITTLAAPIALAPLLRRWPQRASSV